MDIDDLKAKLILEFNVAGKLLAEEEEEEEEVLVISLKDITERKQAEEALQTSRTELETMNRIANVFLTETDETIYPELLDVVLDVMESEFGFVSYINERGDLVSPSMTRTIWDQCQIPDKSIIFPKENWVGLWGKSLLEKKPLMANEGLKVPPGHVPLKNALCVPILHRGTLIGQIAVANKSSGYSDEDQRILVDIANHMAPILNARLKSSRETEERRQAEEALNESQKILLESQKIGQIGSYVLDIRSGIWESSALLDDIFGIDEDFERSVEGWSSIIHPEWRQVMVDYLTNEVIGQGQSFDKEYRIKRPRDGISRWVHGKGELSLNSDGQTVRMIGTVQDITERKRSAETIHESEERFRTLYESAPIGMALVRDSYIVDPNKTLVEMLGYTPRELEKHPLQSLFHPGDWKRTAIASEETASGWSGDFKLEQRLRTKRGRYKWVSLTGSTLPITGEGPPYSILMVEDITARKKAQEQLLTSQGELRDLSVHLQALQEKERISIARELHDRLGAALTDLKMDISWLMDQVPKEQQSLGEKVTAQIDDTIQAVRDISTELRPSLLDDWGLVPAIEWVVQEFQRRTGLECHLDLPVEFELEIDRSTAIFRILQEGLTNVIRHAAATRVEVWVRKTSRYIALKIIDNGVGIKRAKVRDRGSLGLLGIRERVLPWGGKFKLHGVRGKGTTLTVQLPIV